MSRYVYFSSMWILRNFTSLTHLAVMRERKESEYFLTISMLFYKKSVIRDSNFQKSITVHRFTTLHRLALMTMQEFVVGQVFLQILFSLLILFNQCTILNFFNL